MRGKPSFQGVLAQVQSCSWVQVEFLLSSVLLPMEPKSTSSHSLQRKARDAEGQEQAEKIRQWQNRGKRGGKAEVKQGMNAKGLQGHGRAEQG